MRMNTDNYKRVVTQKGISDETVRKSTGLSEKTFLWILDNQYIEFETLERIADAIGCKVGEIIMQDSTSCNENVIEWSKDQKRATLTLSQRRTITRVEELAEAYPEECEIVAKNKDGSVYAHIPTEWIRINPRMNLSEEQRAALIERAAFARRNILKTNNR